MKLSKKIICVLLSAVMVLSAAVLTAGAQGTQDVTEEELLQRFAAYLDENNVSHTVVGGDGEEAATVRIITQANGWTVFKGSSGVVTPACIATRIGRCVVISKNIYMPYEPGLYAEKDGVILTLEEAHNSGELDFDSITDSIKAARYELYSAGDVNQDSEITMNDVLDVQKALANYGTISFKPGFMAYDNLFMDFDGNYEINIKDVLGMQKVIAKIAI